MPLLEDYEKTMMEPGPEPSTYIPNKETLRPETRANMLRTLIDMSKPIVTGAVNVGKRQHGKYITTYGYAPGVAGALSNILSGNATVEEAYNRMQMEQKGMNYRQRLVNAATMRKQRMMGAQTQAEWGLRGEIESALAAQRGRQDIATVEATGKERRLTQEEGLDLALKLQKMLGGAEYSVTDADIAGLVVDMLSGKQSETGLE